MNCFASLAHVPTRMIHYGVLYHREFSNSLYSCIPFTIQDIWIILHHPRYLLFNMYHFLLHRFEKYQNESQETSYALAGYATVYKYFTTPFSLPPKWRPRLSQLIVLPPYQGVGLGPRLYESICKRFLADPDVVSITGETDIITGHEM